MIIVIAAYVLVASQRWIRTAALRLARPMRSGVRRAWLLAGRVGAYARLRVRQLLGRFLWWAPCLLLLVVAGCSIVVQALEEAMENEEVACMPDRLVARGSDPVRLQGWAMPRGHGDPELRWTSSTGRLIGRGAEVRWDLSGAAPDRHSAVVTARDTAGTIGRCSVQVEVSRLPPTIMTLHDAGFALLLRRSERAGYGLYSYLLLPVRPSTASTPRVRSAIEYFSRVRAEAGLAPTGREVVLYVPIARDSALARAARRSGLDPGPLRLRRARALIRDAARPRHDGPLLIVCDSPLTRAGPGHEVIVNDLSFAPADLMDAWIRHQVYAAAGEGSWTQRLWRLGVLRDPQRDPHPVRSASRRPSRNGRGRAARASELNGRRVDPGARPSPTLPDPERSRDRRLRRRPGLRDPKPCWHRTRGRPSYHIEFPRALRRARPTAGS
jgi:hypothetical protein